MPRDKKFHYEVNNQSDGSEILIYGFIGQWDEVDYKGFQDTFRKLLNKSKNVTVRIHSGGGSVYEGLAIYDLMRSSDTHIKVIVEGMAASMASVLALGGDTIEMTENAFFMMHAPSGGYWGSKEGFKSYIQQLENCENRLKEIYKERTKASDQEIENWMKPNQDTWLDSTQCKELKICDKVIVPTKKRSFEEKDVANKTMEEMFAAYEGELPNNKNSNPKIMKGQILTMLAIAGITHSLSSSSEESDFVKQLENVFADAKKANQLDQQLTAIKQKEAEQLIASALKDGKLKADEKEEWIANALKYPDLIAKTLERMVGVVDVNAALHKNPPHAEEGHALLKGRSEWDFEKWQKEDPKNLAKLQEEAPEEFAALFNKKYN